VEQAPLVVGALPVRVAVAAGLVMEGGVVVAMSPQ